MSRPKPKVLIESVSRGGARVDQILEAEAIWAVFYKNAPFNLKSSVGYSDDSNESKYKKVAFSNPGHAHGLARKLNEQFSCDDFSVVMLYAGIDVPDPTKTPKVNTAILDEE